MSCDAPQDEVLLDPHGEERGTPRVSNHEATGLAVMIRPSRNML